MSKNSTILTSRKVIPAHRALVIVLWINGLRNPLYVELLHKAKPADALISALRKLLPPLRKLFSNLVFLCDTGLTYSRLLEFLLSEEVDFVCAISQREGGSGEQGEAWRLVVFKT